jgi:endonuclease-3
MATRKPDAKAATTAKAGARPSYPPSELIALLGAEYGRLPDRPHGDPMAELVLTLLSQNTSDHNSGRAFQRLLARFPGWDEVLAAPTAEVEEAIRPGGLAPTKAPRLQALIGAAREGVAALAKGDAERDPYDLHFLEELPLNEAKAWLRALPGVGPKTAACVLLFALDRPALPVDTHVERVARRLGLVPPKMPVERVHDELEAMLAPDEVYAFHVDLIQHGRRTCHARRPECERCVLLDHCPRIGLEGPRPEREVPAESPSTST